jgi:hypothetical protein
VITGVCLLIALLAAGLVFLNRPVGIPVIPYQKEVGVTLDGVVQDGEYPSGQSLDPDWLVAWVHDGTNIYMAVTTPGKGWIGAGFLPRDAGIGNKGAYLVMVGDEDGEPVARNVHGIGDQVLVQPGDGPNAAIRRNEKGSAAEFVIPLRLPPGDWDLSSLDPGGTYRFIAAYQDTSSVFIAYHGKNRRSLEVMIGE